MSFDTLMYYIDTWCSTFGGFIDKLFIPFGEVLGDFSIVLPDYISQHTLFGLMFGYGLAVFLSVTLVKWIMGVVK